MTGDRAYLLTASGQDQHRALQLLEQPQHLQVRPAPPEGVRLLVAELLQRNPSEDDTTVVCLDWTEI